MTAASRVEETRRGHARGWSYTPLHGKKPILDEWQKAPRETLDRAEEWAGRGNVGLRTGHVSGVVVVDVDLGKGAVRPEEASVATWTARTGGGGLHVLYALPSGVTIGCPTTVWGKGSHVEIKCEGGQVVAVGSIHPDTGRTYAWEPGLSPDDLALAPIPPALLVRIVTHEAARKMQTSEPRANVRPIAASPDICRARATLPRQDGPRDLRIARARHCVFMRRA